MAHKQFFIFDASIAGESEDVGLVAGNMQAIIDMALEMLGDQISERIHDVLYVEKV